MSTSDQRPVGLSTQHPQHFQHQPQQQRHPPHRPIPTYSTHLNALSTGFPERDVTLGLGLGLGLPTVVGSSATSVSGARGSHGPLVAIKESPFTHHQLRPKLELNLSIPGKTRKRHKVATSCNRCRQNKVSPPQHKNVSIHAPFIPFIPSVHPILSSHHPCVLLLVRVLQKYLVLCPNNPHEHNFFSFDPLSNPIIRESAIVECLAPTAKGTVPIVSTQRPSSRDPPGATRL